MADYEAGWWLSGDSSGASTTRFRENISRNELGEPNQVLIRVTHSALNYKDALALSGAPGVVRSLPLIPGIDAVGEVLQSPDSRFSPGDRIVVTGWGYGEERHGGLCTALLADPDHLMHLPAGFTTHQGASWGTAGLTAALAVQALERHDVTPGARPIAVTGAAGAVGSFAVFLLARHGYRVTAITGRTDEADYLHALGATKVVSRQEVLSWPQRPLITERFSGLIDQAGGPLLATLLASLEANGVAASCGLAGGSQLNTTVMPFILRGVTLVGINSVSQPPEVRSQIWAEAEALSSDIPWATLTTTIALGDALENAAHVLASVTRGRVVVEMPV